MERIVSETSTSPEVLKLKFNAGIRVAVLGGNESAEGAMEIGRNVSSAGYSIVTGGHTDGAMSGALLGAVEGRKPDALLEQRIEAIVTGRDPQPKKARTSPVPEQVSVISAQDPYERMKMLVSESDVLVIMNGEKGTKAELLAALMEAELDIEHGGVSEKMIIIVGVEDGIWDDVHPVPISKYQLQKMPNLIFVDTPGEVAAAVEKLFQDKSVKEDK